jgi:allantoin racemase
MTTRELRRIANLVPPGYHGYGVRPDAVADGFSSEIFELTTGISFVNELDRTVTGLNYAEAGLRAEAAGYYAILINTVGDYGIRELRSAVRIPVVGAGQASFQVAAGLGDRFGVLTVWPQVTGPMYRRLLTDYGFADRCVGVRHVAEDEELAGMGGEGGLVSEMRDLREEAIARIVAGGRDLLHQGAEVVVLGCTCMSPARDELQKRLGCPVVDPLAAAHKTAEMLVTLDLAHPAAAVPPILAALLPGSAGGEIEIPADEVCGDTCSILGPTEPALR